MESKSFASSYQMQPTCLKWTCVCLLHCPCCVCYPYLHTIQALVYHKLSVSIVDYWIIVWLWFAGDKLVGEVSRLVVAEACIQVLDIDFTEGQIYEINSVPVISLSLSLISCLTEIEFVCGIVLGGRTWKWCGQVGGVI